MKEFNLEAAIANPGKLVFRDYEEGGEILDFIYLKNAQDAQPIVVVDDTGYVSRYYADGSFEDEGASPLDLMIRDEFQKLWANLYRDKYGQVKISKVYFTKYSAKGMASQLEGYIETIPIEWEE